jgi:hypothetical protein
LLEHKRVYLLSLSNYVASNALLMSSRSELSLEKDKFNFAIMLAHDLKEFPTLECIALTPQQRLSVLGIYLRIINRCVVNPEDLQEIESLLGISKASRLENNAILKARLETDFVNS